MRQIDELEVRTRVGESRRPTRTEGGKTSRASAFYGIAMGLGLLGTWVVLFWNGIPSDFQARPLESWFLLAAEVLTGASLVLGGYGILTGRRWGLALHLVSLGMLLYTCVWSIGVFAQTETAPAVIWFVVISLTTLVLVIIHVVRAART